MNHACGVELSFVRPPPIGSTVLQFRRSWTFLCDWPMLWNSDDQWSTVWS